MKPLSFMLIAGDPSGDLLAAELVTALREKALARSEYSSADVQPLQTALAPRFFGAGGPKMVAAGVEQVFDLTQHSVIGFAEVLKNLGKFKRLFRQLLQVAIERQPDVIIGVDYGGFNLRFAKAIKAHVRAHRSAFNNWSPKIVQFVSPQVWASRASRAYTLAENHDLLLSIFPFEKEWYARRVPGLRVEFVGHPMVGRGLNSEVQSLKSEDASVVSLSSLKGGEGRGEEALFLPAESQKVSAQNPSPQPSPRLGGAREMGAAPCVVLLPGSRADEIRRHLPIVTSAFELLKKVVPTLRGKMVLPRDAGAPAIGSMHLRTDCDVTAGDKSATLPTGLEIQLGDLSTALAEADLAITKSGTVTMECALHGAPAVVFYKTSWPTYFIGKQIITVKYLAMPNLIADEPIYPEFVQQTATPENIAGAALELLRNEQRRAEVQGKLARVIESLGSPGAPQRAAAAILSLV